MSVAVRRLMLVVLVVVAFPAQATLIDNGDGTITDTDTNLIWLQDANYARTSGYEVINGGRMVWGAAVIWADSLVFAGFDNWRLPATLQPDPSCSDQDVVYSVVYGSGLNCTGSEMGNLFSLEGITTLTPGPFINLQSSADYWSGTDFLASSPGQESAWVFRFSTGQQSAPSQNNGIYSWAVRDAETISLPEPTTTALLALGLLGATFARKRASLTG